MTRKKTKAIAGAASPERIQLPAVTQLPPAATHPHQNLDRAVRASVARFTGGVSPHAIFEAWSDWALHLSRAPGRQLELMERAQANALELMGFATGAAGGHAPVPPFAPRDYDHRFTHEGWKKLPFSLWQQGFLAMQDWWDQATAELRGLRSAECRAHPLSWSARCLMSSRPRTFRCSTPKSSRPKRQDRWPQPDRRGGAFRQ